MNSSKPRLIQKLNVPNKNKNKNKNNNKDVPPLVSCVFHPFDGPLHKMESVPDGDNSNRLLIDHSTYTDFTINTGGILTLRTLPTLPFCAVYQPGNGTTFTASDPILGTVSGSFGNGVTNAWTPCNTINQYASTFTTNNVYTVTTPPYSQTQCRIITMAWRIIYTGTVSNGCGMITCRDLPIMQDNLTGLPVGGGKVADMLNSTTSTTTKQIQVAMIDFPIGAGGLDVGKSVFTRLDSNPWGIVKRNNRLYTWRNYLEQPYSFISSSTSIEQIGASTTTPVPLLLTYNNNAGSVGVLGVNLWDVSFNGTEVRISNVNANVSFRFEVKICVEYMVLPSSPVYSLTKNPVKPDLSVIEAVQSKASELQPAMNQNEVIKNPTISRPITTSDIQQITKVKPKTQAKQTTTLIDQFAKTMSFLNPSSRSRGRGRPITVPRKPR
nr:hypothetical protein [Tolivirales sp.]